jgi:hypothetical protein
MPSLAHQRAVDRVELAGILDGRVGDDALRPCVATDVQLSIARGLQRLPLKPPRRPTDHGAGQALAPI